MFALKKAVPTIILTALLCLAPAGVKAQTSVKVRDSGSLTRAIELHQSAIALYSQPKRAAEAARVHLEEATYRSRNDPEAVEALVMAANLFNYAHQPINARKAMESAAKRALMLGDVVGAAQAYTSAAFLAQKSGNTSEMKRLGRQAILLSESPLLEPGQSARIRSRFLSNPTFAELTK